MQLRSFKSPEPIGKVGRQVLSAFFLASKLQNVDNKIQLNKSGGEFLVPSIVNPSLRQTNMRNSQNFKLKFSHLLLGKRGVFPIKAPQCMCTAQYNGRGLHRLCQPWCHQSLTLKSILLGDRHPYFSNSHRSIHSTLCVVL